MQPLLVASSQKWAVGCWCWASSMERWAGGKVVRALACGRECEVMMGGASLAGCADVLSGCGVVVWLAAQRFGSLAVVGRVGGSKHWSRGRSAVGSMGMGSASVGCEVSHGRILRESSEI